MRRPRAQATLRPKAIVEKVTISDRKVDSVCTVAVSYTIGTHALATAPCLLDELSFDADLDEVCRRKCMHINSTHSQQKRTKHAVVKRWRHWRRRPSTSPTAEHGSPLTTSRCHPRNNGPLSVDRLSATPLRPLEKSAVLPTCVRSKTDLELHLCPNQRPTSHSQCH